LKLLTVADVRAIDRAASEEFGMAGIVLMENAARGVFGVLRARPEYGRGYTVVFCGTGGNGGDGFALARHIANDGRGVECVLAGDAARLRGDALANYEICLSMGIRISDLSECAGIANGAALIVDAVLGTGALGELSGAALAAARIMNSSVAAIVAVDCPTGGDPDTGRVSPDCVRAEETVALCAVKPGLMLFPLAGYAGRVSVAGIGAPKALFDRIPDDLSALTDAEARALIPPRAPDSHKGDFGKAAIVAGLADMPGAAAFAALSAYRAGCGLVRVVSSQESATVVRTLAPQAITSALESTARTLEIINESTAALIGPGLGRGDGVSALVDDVIENARVPLVVDADGLNALSGQAWRLKSAASMPVITPHPKEAERLFGVPATDLMSDPLGYARRFAEESGAVTLLKGASTVVAAPDGQAYINCRPAPALAKAGSGDILAGVILAYLARGLEPLTAAALAAYVHSAAGVAAGDRPGADAIEIINLIGVI
jgi:NAD(P)H-hydrate epimerase